MTYTLGIDIGTTSICALARNTETGKPELVLNRPNRAALPSPAPYARLQDPAVILETVRELLAAATEQLGSPAAIGFSGQMHGILCLDRNGDALSPLYTWQDARASLDAGDGECYTDRITRLTGYRVPAGYGLATFYTNLVRGEVPAGTAKLCTVHDWAAMRLTGLTAPLTHPSDAASLGLYDLRRAEFDRHALAVLGISPDLLPEIAPEREPIGHTPDGVPVFPALGDNQASFLGAAGKDTGRLLVNIGTGSQVSTVGALGDPLPGIEYRPFLDGSFLLVGSSLCGGRAYALLEKLFRDIANLCGADIRSAYPFMDRLTEQDAAPAGLTVDTRFDGTRADPALRGCITGISVDNLTPRALTDGFMDGIADELYGLYHAMGDVSVHEMIGSGNGLRANPALCRAVTRRFGMPLTLTATREEAALGAAIYAWGGLKR